ncbi:uncharacterized protein RSE6_08925 [Rhynchosporium secalis]|uniref:Uncharacterized protein n=1 Tax=Rhynchosporium secalis TaxID=38038 RepID=A0A1E1MGN8_RHYSE|nr:uncharacterized protein RSE6_08925 [Rhynchosporium secalis]
MRFYYRSSHFKPASNDGVIVECLNVPSESKVSKFAFGEAKVLFQKENFMTLYSSNISKC